MTGNNVVLTETQVLAIRANIEGLSVKAIAEKYGVSRSSIYSILNGESWSWLESP